MISFNFVSGICVSHIIYFIFFFSFSSYYEDTPQMNGADETSYFTRGMCHLIVKTLYLLLPINLICLTNIIFFASHNSWKLCHVVSLSIMNCVSPCYPLSFRSVHGSGYCSSICASRCNSHYRNSLFVSVGVSNTANITFATFISMVYLSIIHICVCVCTCVCLLLSVCMVKWVFIRWVWLTRTPSRDMMQCIWQ